MEILEFFLLLSVFTKNSLIFLAYSSTLRLTLVSVSGPYSSHSIVTCSIHSSVWHINLFNLLTPLSIPPLSYSLIRYSCYFFFYVYLLFYSSFSPNSYHVTHFRRHLSFFFSTQTKILENLSELTRLFSSISTMAGDEPPFLSVGTDVSAKYRGAFCEAKVKKIVRSVKCKVFIKETQTSVMVTDDQIQGPLKVGASVVVNVSETNQVAEGVINKVNDCSMYTVVFDDGDERTLRRSQLCLKGEKHFVESETLDHLPLSHPEHFGTPVMQSKKGKRGRYSASGLSSSFRADYEEDSSSEESPPKRASYKGRFQELVGKVMCMESGDKRKSPLYVPVLVVLPDAHPVELKSKDHLLVRSFKDGKFITIPKRDLKDFTRDIALKNEDKGLKAAMEKALLYFDCHELPQNWAKEELLGTDDDSENDDEESSDDEPSEEEDRFVAQLYKFMDDRGTPINKGPSLGNKDLNLYKLFKIVQNFGGYNKVTNTMKWRWVYSKMKMLASNTGSHQIKNAYKKYLHAFEDFYRKLGSTMGTISRPRSSRHSTGRSILFLRARDSCRSRERKTAKDEEKSKDEEDKKSKDSDASKDKTDEQSPSVTEETESESKDKCDEEGTKKESSKKEKTKREKDRLRREVKEEPDSDKKDDTKHTRKRDDDKKGDTPKSVDKKTNKKDKEAKTPDVKKELPKKRVRKRSTRGDDVKKEADEKTASDSQKSKVVDMWYKDDKNKDSKSSQKEEKNVKDKKSKEDKNKEMREDKKESKIKTEPDDDAETKRSEDAADTDEEEDEEEEEEEEEDESKSVGLSGSKEYPTGTKLKVKYGRGRNQKIYEAKVVEFGAEGGHEQYLVHYAGWNTRYDEWVRPERIVKVIGKPELGNKKKSKSHSPRSPKGVGATKKRVPSQSRTQQSNNSTKEENLVPVSTTCAAAVAAAATVVPVSPPSASSRLAKDSQAKVRPTRSNSMEFLVVEGLPPESEDDQDSEVEYNKSERNLLSEAHFFDASEEEALKEMLMKMEEQERNAEKEKISCEPTEVSETKPVVEELVAPAPKEAISLQIVKPEAQPTNGNFKNISVVACDEVLKVSSQKLSKEESHPTKVEAEYYESRIRSEPVPSDSEDVTSLPPPPPPQQQQQTSQDVDHEETPQDVDHEEEDEEDDDFDDDEHEEPMRRDPLPGGESPHECNASTISNDSCGSSSGNIPSSDSSNDVAPPPTAKRKREDLEFMPAKKKKRTNKTNKTGIERRRETKPSECEESYSVEDKGAETSSPEYEASPISHALSTHSSLPKSNSITSKPPRISKYNFNLDEAQYLDGEKLITFLMDKIQQIRRIYMNLKTEVASIDRRRKRAKRKERENSQTASNLEVECV
ncbi:AT-rich interactive domain-containing protein 4A,AT-rich interactive domain-containing protein 4B [Acanthosepion pharaonis]|uniref:AT-rich interactive domain-containing protein 4A,AT-rich interactive domain-containing protein 4B n=1 Tax=Acanthosepion pharaonis TaxID=158019 RepID=A0A812AU58_ACAPH|nr:AT-rich interactive domain-containing protein 4A,AT-rich interactive domain-containing protein 4B [Sepia pharaonis]